MLFFASPGQFAVNLEPTTVRPTKPSTITSRTHAGPLEHQTFRSDMRYFMTSDDNTTT